MKIRCAIYRFDPDRVMSLLPSASRRSRVRSAVTRPGQAGSPLERHQLDFINFTTQRYATIPNHPGDIPDGTRRAVPKQAGVKPDRR
jgi:hypothetical protein